MNEYGISLALPRPEVVGAAQFTVAGAACPNDHPQAGLPAAAGEPQMGLGTASASTAEPWFVCLTKPRQEVYAQAKLREQGYEVYLPLLDSWARRASQWCRKQSVMFPRYAFVRPGFAGQSISPARSTPGVTSLVNFGPVLASLPADKLCVLQGLLAQRAAALPGKPLAAGQQVVFASGPFKGMAGIVSSVAGERVSVLMTLLGQQQDLQTSINDLAAA